MLRTDEILSTIQMLHAEHLDVRTVTLALNVDDCAASSVDTVCRKLHEKILARAGALVTGVDLTPASVELVRKRFALEGVPGQAQVADAEHLPFEDNSFDVVYSFGVLHHTPDTQKAIDEVHRVLKPGGRIIIMLYHTGSVHVYLGAPLYRMAHKLRPGARSLVEDWVRVYDGAENPLGKAYSRSELRTMFARFKNLQFTGCDPIRRKYPAAVNWLNQKFLSRRWGFWIVIKGTK